MEYLSQYSALSERRSVRCEGIIGYREPFDEQIPARVSILYLRISVEYSTLPLMQRDLCRKALEAFRKTGNLPKGFVSTHQGAQ